MCRNTQIRRNGKQNNQNDDCGFLAMEEHPTHTSVHYSVIELSLTVTTEHSASWVLAGSPSRGGDVAIYVSDINQPSLHTPFYSVLVSVSVFMALSTVFHSINSPDNSPLSHSVLPVLFLPYWSFQLYIYLFMKVSFSSDIIHRCWLGLKRQLTN